MYGLLFGSTKPRMSCMYKRPPVSTLPLRSHPMSISCRAITSASNCCSSSMTFWSSYLKQHIQDYFDKRVCERHARHADRVGCSRNLSCEGCQAHPRSIFHCTSLIGRPFGPFWAMAPAARKSLQKISAGLGRDILCVADRISAQVRRLQRPFIRDRSDS